jgi:hypothetical protein
VVVLVALAVAQAFHQLGRRVAQVHRHVERALLFDRGARLVVSHVGRVALRRHGQPDRQLRQPQLAFGAAQTLVGIPCVQRHAPGARLGQAHVFDRHARHAAGQIQRIDTAVEHAAQPVHGRVRVGRPHGFVQCRDLVVELLALLVEAARAVGQHLAQRGVVDASVLG